MTTLIRATAWSIALAAVAPAVAGLPGTHELWHSAAGLESATLPASEAVPAEAAKTPAPNADEAAKPGAVPLTDADRKKKGLPKPVAPPPLTPEQATHKAADPKAPTGALIVKPPEDLPAPAAGSPSPPVTSPAK
jgi:hypothetical protein